MTMSTHSPLPELVNVTHIPQKTASAIPAFLGYTRFTSLNDEDLVHRPIRISSLIEYEAIFGARVESFTVGIDTVNNTDVVVRYPQQPDTPYRLYYALQLYFANGGGPCYIVSLGADDCTHLPWLEDFKQGLAAVANEQEPTLLTFPDAELLNCAGFYEVYQAALAQCYTLGNRFTLCDVYHGHQDYNSADGPDVMNDGVVGFRARIGNAFLSHGAAFYPHVETSLTPSYDEESVAITGTLGSRPVAPGMVLRKFTATDARTQANSLYHVAPELYQQIKNAIMTMPVVLPPSSAVAGVYASIDASRSARKAPGNVSLRMVRRPLVTLDNAAQTQLNIDTAGKSVNVLRAFTSKGVRIWGDRTLDGHSPEWRHITVRRFFNMVTTTAQKATQQFAAFPNDASTWGVVRTMLEDFLSQQWRAGALVGARPEQAFFVKVGLHETMSLQDVYDGTMIIEMGIAMTHPGEFMIIRYEHEMPVGATL